MRMDGRLPGALQSEGQSKFRIKGVGQLSVKVVVSCQSKGWSAVNQRGGPAVGHDSDAVQVRFMEEREVLELHSTRHMPLSPYPPFDAFPFHFVRLLELQFNLGLHHSHLGVKVTVKVKVQVKLKANANLQLKVKVQNILDFITAIWPQCAGVMRSARDAIIAIRRRNAPCCLPRRHH